MKLWHRFWAKYHDWLSQWLRNDGIYQSQRFIRHRMKRKKHLEHLNGHQQVL